ncbi:SGNH/GDSL hydrolase family protein [Gordonia sp. NPDC003425]
MALSVVLAVRADKGVGQNLDSTASLPARQIVTGYIIGDSYTQGTDLGGVGARNWTNLVKRKLRSDNVELQLDVLAPGGSGYLSRGPRDITFVELAERVTPDAQIVILFGSRNDIPMASEVDSAATKALDVIGRKAPSAAVIVVGAHFAGTPVPPGISSINRQLQAVAMKHQATFVNPEGWVQDPEEIGTDKVHPNDLGHLEIAERMAPILLTAITPEPAGAPA